MEEETHEAEVAEALTKPEKQLQVVKVEMAELEKYQV